MYTVTYSPAYIEKIRQKHGQAFIDDCTNPDISITIIIRKYGVTHHLATKVAKTLGVSRHNHMHKHMPGYMEALRSKMSSKAMAKKFGVSVNTIRGQRWEMRGNRSTTVRLDGPTTALLKSKLSTRDVARALNRTEHVVRFWRRKLVGKTRVNASPIVISPETKAIIYAAPDCETAHALTGLSKKMIWTMRNRRGLPTTLKPQRKTTKEEAEYIKTHTRDEIQRHLGWSRARIGSYIKYAKTRALKGTIHDPKYTTESGTVHHPRHPGEWEKQPRFDTETRGGD